MASQQETHSLPERRPLAKRIGQGSLLSEGGLPPSGAERRSPFAFLAEYPRHRPRRCRIVLLLSVPVQARRDARVGVSEDARRDDEAH